MVPGNDLTWEIIIKIWGYIYITVKNSSFVKNGW